MSNNLSLALVIAAFLLFLGVFSFWMTQDSRLQRQEKRCQNLTFIYPETKFKMYDGRCLFQINKMWFDSWLIENVRMESIDK